MRKTKYVTINADNRDKGKTFLITEMPAAMAEEWAARAFLGLAKSGVEIPEYIRGAGMAGLAVVSLKALGGVKFSDPTDPEASLKSLMDDMFACIKVVRDKSHPEMAFPLIEDDVEEVQTRLFLRDQVFELHTGFSFAGEKLNSTSPATTESSTSDTQTSPAPSAQ